jgi:hypothetical protein
MIERAQMTVAVVAAENDSAMAKSRARDALTALGNTRGAPKIARWAMSSDDATRELGRGDALIALRLSQLVSKPGDLLALAETALRVGFTIHVGDIPHELTTQVAFLRVTCALSVPLESEAARLREQLREEQAKSLKFEVEFTESMRQRLHSAVDAMAIVDMGHIAAIKSGKPVLDLRNVMTPAARTRWLNADGSLKSAG